MIELYPHQKEALSVTSDKNNVAYYHDMGLGKTFTGAEKMIRLGAKVNLVVCQKSKIYDWFDHFDKYYPDAVVVDLTDAKEFKKLQWYLAYQSWFKVFIINYELAFRRPELKKLTDFTLMLDESSMIQNENAKRSKFIMNLHPKNVILLSGTPTGGKYEKLWSQLHLLGWNISKKMFLNQFVKFHYDDRNGFPLMIIDGYKNEGRLKRKMREYGCHFLKTDEVFDLPRQIHQTIRVDTTKEYRKFRKDSIVTLKSSDSTCHVNGIKDCTVNLASGKCTYGFELVGDTTLTKMLYERQLCGQYNKAKLEAFRDLVESTNDRLVVFYNFWDELKVLEDVAISLNRPISVVNGKAKVLDGYENYNDSVSFIQYQAGAMGLNLQKANKIVYFTPPLSSELFEQSKKRIHRIGQSKPCFYYYLTCKNSIEGKIYRTLEMRKDYTEALFEEGGE